jgi:hypothetical protein
MASSTEAAFRIYNNIGFAPNASDSAASFRVYENIGYYVDKTLSKNAAFSAAISTGIEPMTPIEYPSAIAYENIGFTPGQRTTITRSAQGWGVIPTSSQTTILLPESAIATATAYENIV